MFMQNYELTTRCELYFKIVQQIVPFNLSLIYFGEKWIYVMCLILLKLFYKSGSTIATSTVLEEFPDHMFLFQCHIFRHVYDKCMYDLWCNVCLK